MIDDFAIIFERPELWIGRPPAIINLAALTVGAALMPYTGLSPVESFNQVFGTVKMRFTPTLNTWAHASYGVIRFRNANVITLPLVIHELWHLFGVRAKNRPTKQLWDDRHTLNTLAASPWPGMHPPSLKGYNVVEQFCNAGEAWTLYLDNDSGALHAWFDAHMPAWVAEAMR